MQRDWRTSVKEQSPLGWKVSNHTQNTGHFNPFSVGCLDCLQENAAEQAKRNASTHLIPGSFKTWVNIRVKEKNGRLIGVAV